ncbi:hypothetical protein FOZ60_009027 [Perkinsus olseni]|uniref:Uncharacterized protein n=1 Tax=Perkinsus olseni TaxID=32597 RepID=A0A7J6NI95_PEROL|nr:hypothetical protein FOZ60_009027 [Perkinsus olseni]
MDPAAYPTGVTAPQNSTTTVLSPEQHWYILADHLVGDVSHWLDDQNQIVLSIAVCFIGLWIMVLGEKTLQLAWLAAGVVSGFYLWYLPVTEWYLPSLATPEAFRIITAVVCGGLGGWIAYLFRLGALFIVNLLFIAPLTFLILTAFIDLSPSQDWLQIRLVLSLLFGTIVSAGVVKGRKIGLRVICVLSGTFLVATTAGFLAEEIEEKNYEDSQPILWRGCVGSCLVDAPEVLSNPSDADCLIGDKLFTFKRPEDLARGWYTEVLELESADYLVEWDVVPNIHNVKQIEGKYAFEIGTDAETPARREWMFAVDTDVERRRWVHTLGSFCKQVWRPDETGLEGQLRILRVKSTKDTPQKTYLMHSDGRAPIIGDGDNCNIGEGKLVEIFIISADFLPKFSSVFLVLFRRSVKPSYLFSLDRTFLEGNQLCTHAQDDRR